MSKRRLTLALITLASLLTTGFAPRAEAGYGLESVRPISDPHQAKIDDRPVGTWRTLIQEKIYFLHVGTGNFVGQSNWMELVLVHPGDKPAFYLHHKMGFATKIGEENYFIVANMSILMSQLRGSSTKDLTESVSNYDIFKYKVSEDHLDVWAADQKFVRAAIEEGKIKGTDQTIDDTPENVISFIKASGEKLFANTVRYTRVK
jgi:hypothetical protein